MKAKVNEIGPRLAYVISSHICPNIYSWFSQKCIVHIREITAHVLVMAFAAHLVGNANVKNFSPHYIIYELKFGNLVAIISEVMCCEKSLEKKINLGFHSSSARWRSKCTIHL